MTSLKITSDKESTSPVVKVKQSEPLLTSKKAYDAAIEEIDKLMKKGEQSLSVSDSKRLKVLAIAAESYEDTYEPLPALPMN